MDNRATNALWLVPLAYVVIDRLVGFIIWQLIVVSGETSVMTPGFSVVLSVATALASACICVFAHYRLVGPLPVQRAFVMAAIAIPLFILGAIATTGLGNFTRYITMVPVQAGLHYVVGFLALPLAALILRTKDAAAPAQGAPVTEAPRPPQSAGTVVLRVVVALLSIGLFLGAGFLVLLILAFGGSHMADKDYVFLGAAVVACLEFGVCFLCSVGVFRRIVRIVRIVIVGLSLPYAAYAITEGGEEGFFAVVGIAIYFALFWMMTRAMEPKAA